MSNRAFIYGLADPETGIVRYVGKANDPATRLASHLRDKASTRKARWLRSLDAPPQVLILEEAPQESWQEAERWWIAYFRRQGADLTNHTEGGEGLVGATSDTRAKISRAAKERMEDPDFRARVFTPERAKRISEALTGLPKSAEHVAKLPQNNPGWNHTDQAKQRISMAMTGRQHTLSTIVLLREANKGNAYGLGNRSRIGQMQSDDERLKKSLSTRGREKPVLHRQRIAAGQAKAWAEGRRTYVQHARIDWPPWSSVKAELEHKTIGEIAVNLGVKRGTLAAYIMRRKAEDSKQERRLAA